MKYFKINYLLIIGLTLFIFSCSKDKMEDLFEPWVKAPGSTIERRVKGHDQIFSVQAILRLALKNPKKDSYVAYGLSNFKQPPIPIYQQIDISKDELGQITITSDRKSFDVVKSSQYYYALELRYYDLNGKLINHQFSIFDEKDHEGSTLQHHQHFFTLKNYALYGEQLVYPMTLDSLYYDEFTFKTNGTNKRIEGTDISPNNVYVPVGNQGTDNVKYNTLLAQRAVEKSTTKEATDIYTDPASGKQYRLYKTFNQTELNKKADQIFTYEYRDTDPVEDVLFDKVKGLDDLGRQRLGKPVQLLQRNRDLSTRTKRDYLGFKGVMQFKRDDIAFQMRICIAHMITPTEKYISPHGIKDILHEYYQISQSWNNYDIDYPLAFRVIADADGDKAKFVADVQKFYSDADGERLLKMFSNDPEWFRHISQLSI